MVGPLPTALEWSCELPERGRAASTGSRPRATLVLRVAGGDEERIPLPVAVGRTLAAREGTWEPTCRAELLHAVREAASRCAMERVSALVARRDYSSAEILEKLRQDGYAEASRSEALERAVACGLVDDARYAAAFVRSKVSAGWGERRIAQALSRKGIEPGDVEGWPEEFLDPEGEASRAAALLERRRLPERDAYGKLMRFLLSRGFPAGVARQAVERRLADAEDPNQRRAW